MRKWILVASLGLNILLVCILLRSLWRDRENFIQFHLLKHPKILMLGDSQIAHGEWSFLLGRTDVVRGGAEGRTSEQISTIVNGEVSHYNFQYCFIECGTNDITLPSYSLDKTMASYIAIEKALFTKHVIPVFQTIPYRLHSPLNSRIDSINVKLKAYCSLHHISLIDLNTILSINNDLHQDYQKDGIHLNEVGYDVWANELKKFIRYRDI